MKLVSIIIPIYNVEKYLDECLNSAIHQSYRNIEIIAVNDGSPDGSGDIIEKFMGMDSRVKHIRQENQGLPRARVNGIAASKGEYLLHLDGDDFLADNCVERMMAEAMKNDADVVYSDAYRWADSDDCQKIIINPLKLSTKNGIEYFESGISTFIWGKLYKREISLNLIPQTVNVNEDVFFNLQMLPRCERIVYLQESLYYYRVNRDSIMNSRRSAIAAQYLEHAMQRRALDSDQRIKDILLYDNISIIYRYLKYIGIDDRIKMLIHLTYGEYKFPRPKSFKELKMNFLLFLSKFSPRVACLLCKMN